jgi:FtsP/CotA-like multicopper oxidase with cupredoxin domain
LPGREIRVGAGDIVDAELVNRLPVETSIHWHGVALRNDMDGAAGVTQPPVGPGGRFRYRFVAPDPGTYWLHPHTGTQLDRGLYAPLIVEDPAEPGRYDAEWVVLLDDWLDGTGTDPDRTLAGLRQGSGMGHMHTGVGGGRLLGGDAGDVSYPYYLVNGRVPSAPALFTGRPRQRMRLRFVNAGSDTAFRVALGGHRLTVTHTDGFGVDPLETDALLIGMGERYDAEVTLADGVFPLVAVAEGKDASAFALVRTSSGSAPGHGTRPAELDRAVAGYDDLHATDAARLTGRSADVVHRVTLTGGMMGYDWGINGRRYDGSAPPLGVREGQRVHVTFENATMMWHPMHIHGHTFQIGDSGPRKDTAIVLPHSRLTCAFDARNPGQWMVHCHNTYHAEAGMMTTLGYRA